MTAQFQKIKDEKIEIREPRIKLIAFSDIKLGTERRDLVKGLIPRVGLTVVWGPPKSGKSFWAFDLMLHVALGWEYRERRVHQGPVVYCAFEGQAGIQQRAEAFRQRRLADDHDAVPFYLQPLSLDLVADHAELIAVIRQTLGSVSPAALCLDTLNRSLRGSESSDQDMTAYIRAADALREAFNCAVIIVHHCGIEGTRPRGHTSLTGAADAQLSVKRDAAGNIIVEVEAAKDGAEGEIVASRLERVEVGVDDDGEPITSCVVVPLPGGIPRPVPSRRLSDRNRLALDSLTEAILAHGRPADPTWRLPAGIKAVQLDAWREELFRRGVLDHEAPNPRQDFKRIRTALAARKLIGEQDGLVWSVHQSADGAPIGAL